MHSTTYKHAAQIADNMFRDIIAIAETVKTPGNFPAAWAVLRADNSERAYSVHQIVFPTDAEPFLIHGYYDLTRHRAFELFTEKALRDCADAEYTLGEHA